MENIINSVKDIGFSGFIDIILMALLIYTVFVGFKKTKAAFVLTGMCIIGGMYLLARQFNLVMTAEMFEKFFAAFFIVLVIIFQEEIRRLFEDVAVWGLRRRYRRGKNVPLTRDEVQILVKTLMEFSRKKIGALIVLRGKGLLDRHLESEIVLDGKLSEPLLKSIFDPHSSGHDGAVIIDGSKVTHFGCHLPLSKNLSKIVDRGTRHAAAIGLSERTDVLCLVVSEERGTVSVAANGDLREIPKAEKLTDEIEKYYHRIRPIKKAKPLEGFLKKNSHEKIYAILLSIGLWFVLVHGSKVAYKSYTVPVTYIDISKEWVVEEIVPKEVKITLRGPRRAFYFNNQNRIKIYAELKRREGHQQVRIMTENFIFPKELILDEYDPHYIKVVLKKKEEKITTKPTGKVDQNESSNTILPKNDE